MLIKKHFHSVKFNLNMCNYRLSYPKKSQKVQVKIKDFNQEPNSILDLNYCYVTNCHQCYIKKELLRKDKYFFNFIVNGHITINPEFPSNFDPEGNYYNVIEVKKMIEEEKKIQNQNKNILNSRSSHNITTKPLQHNNTTNRNSSKSTKGLISIPPFSENYRIKEYKFDNEETEKAFINFDVDNSETIKEVDKSNEVDVPKQYVRRQKKLNTTTDIPKISIDIKPILRKNSSKILNKKVSFSGNVEVKF